MPADKTFKNHQNCISNCKDTNFSRPLQQRKCKVPNLTVCNNLL